MVFVFIVAWLLMAINWFLTGSVDHTDGLVGIVCFRFTCYFTEKSNNIRNICLSYKPAGWTFKTAVKNYRIALRRWINKATYDIEYQKAVKIQIDTSKRRWERRFFYCVNRKVTEILEKRKNIDWLLKKLIILYTTKEHTMPCCDGWDYTTEKVNGKCPECGEPTIDGSAPTGCNYSPVVCKTCADAPCDSSC